MTRFDQPTLHWPGRLLPGFELEIEVCSSSAERQSTCTQSAEGLKQLQKWGCGVLARAVQMECYACCSREGMIECLGLAKGHEGFFALPATQSACVWLRSWQLSLFWPRSDPSRISTAARVLRIYMSGSSLSDPWINGVSTVETASSILMRSQKCCHFSTRPPEEVAAGASHVGSRHKRVRVVCFALGLSARYFLLSAV